MVTCCKFVKRMSGILLDDEDSNWAQTGCSVALIVIKCIALLDCRSRKG